MRPIQRVNSAWEHEQTIKIAALFSAAYKSFGDKLRSLYKRKISHQFLFPSSHGHKRYNVYKRQFSVLLEKDTLSVRRRARKLTLASVQQAFDVGGAQVTDLVHDGTLYAPPTDVDDMRYSIMEIKGGHEETCVLCRRRFVDIEAHYRSETEVSDTTRVTIAVHGIGSCGVSEQVITIDVQRDARIGDVKRRICEVIQVPVSRQQLVVGDRVLKNSDGIVSLDMVLREKKK